MTSQLILLNGFGVALASDSAMTLGNKRTYETAEKVIPLPGPHRLAVLHSGAVNIHGMPYSVLINEWAATLGATPLRAVALYRQNFLSWLNDNHDWVGPTRVTDDFIYQLNDIYRAIWNRINEAIEEDDSEATKAEKCLAIWNQYTSHYLGLPSLSHSGGDWISQAYTKVEKEISDVRNYWFDDIPINLEINQQIDEFTRLFLERGHFDNRAQLAFVGFGDKQLLPGYANVEISGILNDSLLYEFTADQSAQSIGNRNYFGICPIGQTSSIDLVLKGLNYQLVNIATTAVMETLFPPDDDQMDTTPESTDEEKEELSSKFYSAIDKSFNSWSEKNYVQALRGAISALPVASLAAVARSLIEVQSLSQTITGEMGTVGGPIDVATISRDNGFQWVRHKSVLG
jgi:hypothetical protein